MESVRYYDKNGNEVIEWDGKKMTILNEPKESMNEPVSRIIDICNRCKDTVDIIDAEICWYCTEWMCYSCWDEFGHCGHKEADKTNKQAK